MEVVIDKLMAFLPNRPSVMTMDVGIIDFTVYRNHDIEPHVQRHTDTETLGILA